VVTITGQHFSGATAVTFGSTPGTITSVTNTQIVAVAPAGSGTVGVTVTGPGGMSAPVQYSYPTPPKDITPPVVTQLQLSAKRFIAANTGPSIAALGVGTRVTVQVSEASTLMLTVARKTKGVKKGKRCLAKAKKRHGRSCTRYVTRKPSLTKAVPAGASSFKFQGRLSGRRLSPGTYRLSVTAKDVVGNVSKVKTANFTIVRG
jgi:IPT/TIG domain